MHFPRKLKFVNSYLNFFKKNYIFARKIRLKKLCKNHLNFGTNSSVMVVQYLDVPDKSENDKKEYKILKLANGIRALLVSDPTPVPDDSDSDSGSTASSENESDEEEEEEQSVGSTSTEVESSEYDSDSEEEGDEKLAAVALCVDVGSFSDPPDINGLAHFLEHMIFMGSEKYPSENEFDSHVKKCGGFDNADTECEETSFYFEISEKHLDTAMDRFAQLFTAPLMKKEAMTREREAIESEFQSKMQDDEVRRDQLLAEFGRPTHPCSVFTWGNSKTLKEKISDDELYERVHEFRKRHYSANRIYLCVQARLPMETIEELAIKHFSEIPCNNLEGDDFSLYNNENAFKDEFFENVYFVKPVSNVCKLEITWCLPSLLKEYRCKPHHYIAYLFGYEGPGSLCAFLRRKLWALELIAGVDDSGFEHNSMYSLFNVYIYLTEEGFHHINEVLAATFAYVKLLEHHGPSERLFKELQDIEKTTFRFQTERSAFDNVQDLVCNLKYYPPKDVLTGPELYFEYNEDQIWRVIRFLNTNKFNIMLTSTNKYNGIVYDHKEKWFGTEYTFMKMPAEWKALWENAKMMPELYNPEPNPFITKDFTILWTNEARTEFAQPKRIVNTDVCELWYRQDDKFLLPISYMYIYFISSLPLQSAKNAVLMTLYSLLLKYQLVEELYPATVAGLNYQYYSSDKGLVLKTSGYNEKLHLIVDIITKKMSTFLDQLDDQQLKVFIKQQQRNYYNWFIKPKSLNKDIRICCVEKTRWPSYVKYSLLKDITIEDLREFSTQILKELKIQALIQGNLTEVSAHNVMNLILKNFNCSPIQDKKLIESRTVQLPLGSNYVICKSFNENDVNTVVTNFYQVGPCTIRTECLLDLLMMFVEEPLFDILRTKEQLGYDVSSSVRNNNGILGYSISVNSQEDKFSAGHVQDRIEAFRVQMLQILDEMPVDDFDHVKESLIKIKLVADNELKDEVSRNWGEITCEEYIFDRSKREVECLRTLTKDDIIEFCKSNERDNLRKLSIQVIGNKTANKSETINNTTDDLQMYSLQYIEDSSATINCIGDFKKGLYIYPVTKTNLNISIMDQE